MNIQKKSTCKTLLKLFVCIVFLGAIMFGALCYFNGGSVLSQKVLETVNKTTSDVSVNSVKYNNEYKNIKLGTENLMFDIESATSLVINAVFINYKDVSDYNINTDIEKYDKLFNDTDFTNDVFSVYEYYYQISKGKLKLKANIIFAESDLYYSNLSKKYYDYSFEKSMYDNGVRNGELAVYNGDYHISMIVSSGSSIAGTMLWPHAYTTKELGIRLILMTYNRLDAGVLCHEIGHVFGLKDLYANKETNSEIGHPVGKYDIMSETVLGQYSSINAYSRSVLGWAEDSVYEDKELTEIETISKDGTYTLQSTLSKTGTIAYKFGEKGEEEFYVEYRKATGKGIDNVLPYNADDGLFIYRINTSVKSNLTNSGVNKNFHMYAFRIADISYGVPNLFGSISTIQNLTYIDGERADITISNIKENNDGTLSFNIDFNDGKCKVTGTVLDKNTNEPIFSARVYVDEEAIAFTDSKGKFTIYVPEGSKITFVKWAHIFDEFVATKNMDILVYAETFNRKIEIIIKDGTKVELESKSIGEIDTIFGYEGVLKWSIPLYANDGDEFVLTITRDDDVKVYDIKFKEIAGIVSVIEDSTKIKVEYNGKEILPNSHKEDTGFFDVVVDSASSAWDTITGAVGKVWDTLFGWI